MRYFLTFLIAIFFFIARASGQDVPFSESAKRILTSMDLASKDIKRIDAFVKKLDIQKTRFKKNKNFINYLNNEVHNEILLTYEQLTSFEDLVSEGKYNCLTGSTFFALLMERYGISYKIVETNYHMFLLIEENDKEYLLDATDPIGGFDTNSSAVQKRVAAYRAKNLEQDAKNRVAFGFDLFNRVEITQLEGLLAYNSSVASYNQQDFLTAVDHLYYASQHYTSPRIVEMAVLIEGYLQGLSDQSIYRKKIATIKGKESLLMARN